jgi:hypothetical protein
MLLFLLGISSAGLSEVPSIAIAESRISDAPSVVAPTDGANEGAVDTAVDGATEAECNESLLCSGLWNDSLLRRPIREKVALIRFSPDELVGLLLLPKREAARESLWTVLSSVGVTGFDLPSGGRMLLAALPRLISVGALLPRLDD